MEDFFLEVSTDNTFLSIAMFAHYPMHFEKNGIDNKYFMAHYHSQILIRNQVV